MGKISSLFVSSMTKVILENNPDYGDWEKDYEKGDNVLQWLIFAVK